MNFSTRFVLFVTANQRCIENGNDDDDNDDGQRTTTVTFLDVHNFTTQEMTKRHLPFLSSLILKLMCVNILIRHVKNTKRKKKTNPS